MPTIGDVARRAGVSPATVSRVLQGATNVHPETRARVEQAIAELGYVPSAVARGLRSKRTRSLALIVPDITNPFWPTVVRGVEDIAHEHDYSVLLGNTDENPIKQKRYLDFLLSQQVDGVIIAPYDSDAGKLEILRLRNVPTVIVDRRIEGWDVDSVIGDSVAGARALVRHLIGLGHRRIAIISGPPMTSTAEDRVAGYCLALAEAGIPVDPRLIRRGEYRAASGARLTHQLLDEGLHPTAIFAGNNTIALGVIEALVKRRMRIPQDMALVSFDDLPNTSHIFPFLTVVAQPAYDLGVNAAQLLLSRLSGEGNLRPRHVVLPPRLIIRYSCGSRMTTDGQCPVSLPIIWEERSEELIVKPLSEEESSNFSPYLAHIAAPALHSPTRLPKVSRSDVQRLLQALQHQETDRVPFFELEAADTSVYEYVLERELQRDAAVARVSGMPVTPEEHVEFALRLGMDAVSCNLCGNSSLESEEASPSLAEQLGYLERYLRAAQGTGVGIVACFPSFFDGAVRAAGDELPLAQFDAWRPQLEHLMDRMLAAQERLVRIVCDRFADELALIVIRDTVADEKGPRLGLESFLGLFLPRMRRLIAPVQEHGKRLWLHSKGKVDPLLGHLYELGFSGVHPVEPEVNDLPLLKKQWAGRLVLAGGISTALLVHGTEEEVERTVRETCRLLSPGGGYVLGSTRGIAQGVSPQNLLALVRGLAVSG
ncbi:MAG: substrate-binding domain-containing protein [Anaerolineae bacterium]|nr:substrate-binding domain-containing protein [Anaerolineae bacterium]